jgi:arabinosaccharide transport system substrate-binding protein
MSFPYGKAAFWIMVLALVSGAGVLAMSSHRDDERPPDLVLVSFAKNHIESYMPTIRKFEAEKGIKVEVQIKEYRAIQQRLQAAFQVGAEVPDMVEIPNGSLGSFARGPLEEVGFVDLTDLIKSTGLYDKVVRSRFSIWTSRGRIFALPHDVHPAGLVYRRDIVERLGIDVNKLDTWEEFCRVGREIVTKDLNGDGVNDRYMIDLNIGGEDYLRAFLLQRGTGIFNEQSDVIFDNEEAVQVTCWYVRQLTGKDRIAFSAGWGQNLAQCMNDGLALFYFAPDWRTYSFQQEVPGLSGKLALMPMPAWEKGGRRVTTWGGTGLAITKACKNFDLAWELAQRLYYDPKELGLRFGKTNIIPPLQSAWDLPEFQEQRPFYSNQRLGEIFSKMAPDTPPDYVTPFTGTASGKLNEAYQNIRLYYERNPDADLEAYARTELKRCADRVRQVIARNAFYTTTEGQ